MKKYVCIVPLNNVKSHLLIDETRRNSVKKLRSRPDNVLQSRPARKNEGNIYLTSDNKMIEVLVYRTITHKKKKK